MAEGQPADENLAAAARVHAVEDGPLGCPDRGSNSVQVEGHAELCKATVDGWLPAMESKVRAHVYGPYVTVYHARYDDAGLAAEPGLAELYEHDVEVALDLAATAAEGGVDERGSSGDP